MTIASTVSRFEYVGSGILGPFPVPFYFLNDSDIRVYEIVIATGAASLLTLATDYTLTGAGVLAGGSLNFTGGHGAPAATKRIVIFRNPQLTQGIDYTVNDKFPAETHEQGLDKLTMIAQRVKDITDRSLHATDYDPASVSMELPGYKARAGKYLGFDANGGPLALDGTLLAADLSGYGVLATGSSTSRTLGARFADQVNVLDFGAKGDGVTDDTVSCFNAVIYAASLIGTNQTCSVWFPPNKSYVLSGCGVVATLARRVTLMGYGARILMPAQGLHVGYSAFTQYAAYMEVYGFKMRGNVGLQANDGWSDSYNGGAFTTGRSYRAAIQADSTAGANYLTVADCYFEAFEGACIASKGCNLMIHDNQVVSNAQEFVYAALPGPSTIIIVNNDIQVLATGDPVVNANAIYACGATTLRVANNNIQNIERSGIYIVGGRSVQVTGNIVDTNSKDTYSAITVDTTGNAISNCQITNNQCYNVNGGIKVLGISMFLLTIQSNQCYTTKGSTGDFLNIAAAASASITNNTGHDIKRHGLIMAGQSLNFVHTGNMYYGQATAASYGMQLSASLGSWANGVCTNNIFSNFEGSAGGLGCVNWIRTGAFVFTIFKFEGNTMLVGNVANRAVSDGGVALLINGSFKHNSTDGKIDMTSTNVRYFDNIIVGAQNTPANVDCIDITSATSATIGAAGGAAVLPATPVGYVDMYVRGVQRKFPYYNP